MADLTLRKLNEAYISFECERSTAQELADYFTFYVPGYQFMPAFKNKLWDGKIRLADLRTFTIYHGLIPYIEKFLIMDVRSIFARLSLKYVVDKV